jgi:hypothetical protein
MDGMTMVILNVRVNGTILKYFLSKFYFIFFFSLKFIYHYQPVSINVKIVLLQLSALSVLKIDLGLLIVIVLQGPTIHLSLSVQVNSKFISNK